MADASIDPTDQKRSIKSATINIATSGDNTIVSAVASKRIKVFAIVLNADNTVATFVGAKWKDGASTDMTGVMDFGPREGYVLDVNPPAFLLGTTAGNALILNLSAALQVNGWIAYWDDDSA